MKALAVVTQKVLPALLLCSILAGCASQPIIGNNSQTTEETCTLEEFIEEEDLPDELVALTEAPPAIPSLLMPEASGTLRKTTKRALIDYSNTKDGYVMVQFSDTSDRRLKAKVIGPSTEYVYNLNPQEWTTFPLADGNGSYTVKVYEQSPQSGKYAVVANDRRICSIPAAQSVCEL